MDERSLKLDHGIRISTLEGVYRTLQENKPYIDTPTYQSLIQVVQGLIIEAKNERKRDLRNFPDLNRMYV